MKRWVAVFLVALGVLLIASACADDDDTPATPAPTGGMVLASDSFEQGSGIPDKYTCVGVGESPPLTWLRAPSTAVSFAVIMDDPDADGFIHWLVYDIPGDVTDLAVGVPPDKTLDNGAKQGKNGFGDIGYGGPCPPLGETHTYRFRVFALDAALGLEPGASGADVETAIQGHILDTGQVTTTAGR